MEVRHLPPELVSLAQHVELNRAGWHEKAIQRLLLASIWLSPKPPSVAEIMQDVEETFRVRVGQSRASRLLGQMVEERTLQMAQDRRYAIAPEALATFEEELSAGERLRAVAKAKFALSLAHHCPALDPEHTWSLFLERFLTPLIAEIGAETYRIMSGTSSIGRAPRLANFVAQFPPGDQHGVAAASQEFFDPSDADTRGFVLGYLNAHFLVEATSLRKETIEAISKEEKPSFSLFFDTNLVFSILNLHDNPSNEAAHALLSLIEQIAPHVSISCQVLAVTLAEAEAVLKAASGYYGRFPIPANIASAALASDLVTGVGRTFIERASASQEPLDPTTYFSAYADNLALHLSGRGIAVSSLSHREYLKDPDVQADIEEQHMHEVKRYGPRAKDHRQLEHDIVLWHLVKDQRPIRPESPAQARFWVVTIDFRFLSFDSHMSRHLGDPIQLCIHPSSLIHMLAFWIPRSPEFEQALLSSMQLPFLFEPFNEESEAITTKIIRTLSMFEQAGDLSTETVGSILLNDALRQRMADPATPQQQVEIVREALLSEAQAATSAVEEGRRREQGLIEDLASSTQSAGFLERQVATLQADLQQAETRTASLTHELEQLAELLKAQVTEAARRRATSTYVVKWVLLPAVIATAALISVPLLISHFPLIAAVPPGKAMAILAIAVAAVWIFAAHSAARRDTAVSQTRFFRAINWLRWALGLLALGILGNAAYEAIKLLFR